MNPWKILGVNRQNTEEEVRNAYLKLARRYHPDVCLKRDTGKFSSITGAYALLKSKKDTDNFIKQMNAVGKPCAACSGKGAKFKQRGMYTREVTTCKECEGSGIILKKGEVK